MSGRTYYLFLGFHGFLLGLFPFFLPVYLYRVSNSLAIVALFVGVTGVGFTLSLWGWERVFRLGLFRMIVFSLLLELFLVFAVFFHVNPVAVALINGAYSCFYWMIQRVLFLSRGTEGNSGRRFGNFQIFVALVLKAGIFAGSLLLEDFGLSAICLLSLVIVLSALLLFRRQAKEDMVFPEALRGEEKITVGEAFSFRDRLHSRPIFMIDGIFLYLESYFWLITLFLIVGESFLKLGIVVILLALVLAALFFLIKERIDQLDSRRVYGIAVFLYVVSWGLRAWLSENMSSMLQAGIIVLVAFSTSFFRLAFNKKFFDYARAIGGYRYLFLKSVYSQFFLAVFFLFFSLFLYRFQYGVTVLPVLYGGAAFCSISYLLYQTEMS
ncbi:hypothetical protein DGMP_02560 [Desulfomarina profundi]|uniref:Uncharacterized protein n=2 Tax=Desulfomarina profundi TaxID=2772557 RepID=A0A8D5FE10_9BACT|nr:hypothetical protein DGMP_02560 [Desulfomarina profundi]